MDCSYVLSSETTKKTDLCIFFSKSEKKSKNFSSSSTGREKLIDLSNKLQYKLLKGHSNEYYKPYTLQSPRGTENRKRKEHRTENNEAKMSVLVEQDRRSKRQKSNDNISNNGSICGNKTFRKDSKLYGLCETERAELFVCVTKVNVDAVFTKVSIFDKADDLFAADIMSRGQCMNR